ELVEALRGEEAQRQVVEAAQQVQQQPAPRPAPIQQQQRPQPQADPLAAQKAQLQARQVAMNMTGEQRLIAERALQWQKFAQQIPEMMSWQAYEYTKQNDPARFAQVQKALAAGKAFNDVAAQRYRELDELRAHRANQWAHAQGARNAQ